ncbi:hypothetical protein [Pleomorphomonas sp. NRK KF1]|uniref:hypothetical protein n=1 Tax=Pleomorphomonas sp. NRK KF1 TaxID=2943000 RepID=UPI002043B27D|nr:hypothetical protein [Pleomorphomonas sp. NRK KF1]MCM5555452.1 hypothetical protein [Pleomorphomonas sp. NRK KF1]
MLISLSAAIAVSVTSKAKANRAVLFSVAIFFIVVTSPCCCQENGTFVFRSREIAKSKRTYRGNDLFTKILILFYGLFILFSVEKFTFYAPWIYAPAQVLTHQRPMGCPAGPDSLDLSDFGTADQGRCINPARRMCSPLAQVARVTGGKRGTLRSGLFARLRRHRPAEKAAGQCRNGGVVIEKETPDEG